MTTLSDRLLFWTNLATKRRKITIWIEVGVYHDLHCLKRSHGHLRIESELIFSVIDIKDQETTGTGIEGRRIGCQESVKSLRQEVIWDSSPLELTECSDIRVSLKDLRIHALTLESCTYIIFRECSLTSPCLQKNWWFHNDRSLNIHPRSFISNPWSAIVLF